MGSMAANVGKQDFNNFFIIGEGGSTSYRGKVKFTNAEYLAHRGIIPETRLKKALLHDNAGDERRLSRSLERLSAHRRRALFDSVRNSKAFQATQHRKKETWKREDRDRLARINFPSLEENETRRESDDGARPPSAERVYSSPRYSGRPRLYVPILPVMVVRAENVDIVRHREQTYVSRMPSIVAVPRQQLSHYDRYRGKKHLEYGEAARDERFVALTQSLSAAESRAAVKDLLVSRSNTIA